MFFSCCPFPVGWNGMCVGFLAYFLATFIIMAYCSMKSVSVMLDCNGKQDEAEGSGKDELRKAVLAAQ